MKKHTFFLVLICNFLTISLFAQVSESEEPMAAGTHNALIVKLEVSDAKLADKVWKDFMKNYGGKTKSVKGSDENLTTNTEIVAINGVNPLNIYSRSRPTDDNYLEMTVWFDMGGEYLSSDRKAQYQEAEKILLKYAHEVKMENTKAELEDAAKKMKSLENEMAKLQRQKDSYHKEIAEAEKRIETAKENIITNDEQQGDTTQKMELQKQLLEEIQRRLDGMKGN